MNILITGGGGFLGQHLARAIAMQREQVILYDLAFPSTGNESLPPQVARICGDITDAHQLSESLRTWRVDIVVHLATLLTDICEQDPINGARVNCVGTATVFATSAKMFVRRVIYGSSVAVFSHDEISPTGDDRPLAPANIYGATKAFSEHLAAAMRLSRPQTDFLGLRFGWVYGPGRVRGWNEIQRVIEGFALEQAEVPFPNYAGANDWTFVQDAVQVILRCFNSPRASGAAFNVSGDYRSIQDAVAHLQLLFPHVRAKPYPAILPPAAWEFRSDRLERQIGFMPTTTLEDGLDRTVALIREAAGKDPLTKD